MKGHLKEHGIIACVYLVLFYALPGILLLVDAELMDRAAPVLVLVFNSLSVLILSNFSTRNYGFHILPLFIPCLLFLPSAFLFYAELQYAYLFSMFYLIAGLMGAIIAELMRKKDIHIL